MTILLVEDDDSIAIVITSPFMVCMTNRGMISNDVIVGLPLIGITGSIF